MSRLVLCGLAVAEEDKRPELPGGTYDKPYVKRAVRGVAVGG